MADCMLVGKRGECPLVVEEAGIRLYSAEEVCYFIVNYFPLIDYDFFSQELFDFLDEECGWTALAQKLRDMKKKDGCSFEECVLMLLRMVRYYNENEIAEFRRELLYAKRSGEEQGFLRRVEMLMKMKNYGRAADTYKKYLKSENFANQSPQFCENLYYNLAVCMIYLNNTRQAMDYLLLGYEQTKHPFIKQAMVELAWMEQMEIPEKIQSSVTEEELQKWKREYQTAVRESAEEVQMKRQKGEFVGIEEWIEEQKDAYRRSVGE